MLPKRKGKMVGPLRMIDLPKKNGKPPNSKTPLKGNENNGDEPVGAKTKKMHRKMDNGHSSLNAEHEVMHGKASDRLPGGRADKKKPADFDQSDLGDGTIHELEHTKDKTIAQEIAMDHLAEDPDYYRKLESMHGKATPHVSGQPYIGPRGGKYADPRRTVPWKAQNRELSVTFHRAGFETGKRVDTFKVNDPQAPIGGPNHYYPARDKTHALEQHKAEMKRIMSMVEHPAQRLAHSIDADHAGRLKKSKTIMYRGVQHETHKTVRGVTSYTPALGVATVWAARPGDPWASDKSRRDPRYLKTSVVQAVEVRSKKTLRFSRPSMSIVEVVAQLDVSEDETRKIFNYMHNRETGKAKGGDFKYRVKDEDGEEVTESDVEFSLIMPQTRISMARDEHDAGYEGVLGRVEADTFIFADAPAVQRAAKAKGYDSISYPDVFDAPDAIKHLTGKHSSELDGVEMQTDLDGNYVATHETLRPLDDSIVKPLWSKPAEKVGKEQGFSIAGQVYTGPRGGKYSDPARKHSIRKAEPLELIKAERPMYLPLISDELEKADADTRSTLGALGYRAAGGTQKRRCGNCSHYNRSRGACSIARGSPDVAYGAICDEWVRANATPLLGKAGHKYKSRKKVKGKWVYEYDDPKKYPKTYHPDDNSEEAWDARMGERQTVREGEGGMVAEALDNAAKEFDLTTEAGKNEYRETMFDAIRTDPFASRPAIRILAKKVTGKVPATRHVGIHALIEASISKHTGQPLPKKERKKWTRQDPDAPKPVAPSFWEERSKYGVAGGPKELALTEAGSAKAFTTGAHVKGRGAAALQELSARGGEMKLGDDSDFLTWSGLRSKGYVEMPRGVNDKAKLTQKGRDAIARGHTEQAKLLERVKAAHGPMVGKAKFKSKKFVNGKWVYKYDEPKKPRLSQADIDKEDAFIDKIIAEQKAFEAHVANELETKGSMLLPMRHSEKDYVSVTPSTYPGVKWQITRWEGNPMEPKSEPTGHTDIKGDALAVAKELRYWVDAKKTMKPASLSWESSNDTKGMPELWESKHRGLDVKVRRMEPARPFSSRYYQARVEYQGRAQEDSTEHETSAKAREAAQQLANKVADHLKLPMHGKRRDGGAPQVYGEQSMPDYGSIYGTEEGLKKITKEQMDQASLRRRADAARMIHQFGFHGEAPEPIRRYDAKDLIPHQETFQGERAPSKNNRRENNRNQVRRLTMKAGPKYIPPDKRDPNYRTP